MTAALVLLGLLLTPEATTAGIAAEEALAELRRDGGQLWGRRIDGVAWCFSQGDRVYLTADPGDAAFAHAGNLWVGPLPRGLAATNTAVTVAGRRCAMVLLPLPDDKLAARRLLIHEAFHVVQPELLPLPPAGEGGAGAALLERPEGRTWLILEWRALAQALESHGPPEAAAVERALLFRARRYAEGSAEERERERLLDLSEGLAEYTAWRLGGGDAAGLARRLRVDAPTSPSYVRSFPYATGPAYGLLLDRRRPGWRAALARSPDLQALLADTVAARARLRPWLAGGGDAQRLRLASDRAGLAFGWRLVRSAEAERWRAREQELAQLRRRFVDAPTLRLQPGRLYVTFDPGNQVALGDAGTVMPGLSWKSADGSALDAPAGALVVPDWSELRLPLRPPAPAEGPLAAPLELAGDGWKLHLAAGWTLRRDGESVIATPSEARAAP